jgi:hypothetical protein
MVLAACAAFWCPEAQAQIPGTPSLAIGAVIGGGPVSGDCLYNNGNVLGQQACGSGTAATIDAGGATSITNGTSNDILFQTTGGKVGEIATANSSVLVTSSGGVPSLATTLPSGLTIPGFAPLAAPTFTGQVNMTGLSTSGTGGTVSSVCWSATAGSLWTDTSGTICGISMAAAKTSPDQWDFLDPEEALAGVRSWRTAAWQYLPEYGDHGAAFHVGLIADDVGATNPRCRSEEGHNYSDRCVEAYLTGAIQALAHEFDEYRRTHP